MLNLERLRILNAVDTYGSVSAAADVLSVTTSAVSQQMAKLERETGLPAVVDNDANVAGFAEARLGKTPFRQMLFLTVGTGIGGGLVLDGEIYRGPTGMGAELGHMIVDPLGPRCGCGLHGCLEAVSSGTALTRMGREAAAADPDVCHPAVLTWEDVPVRLLTRCLTALLAVALLLSAQTRGPVDAADAAGLAAAVAAPVLRVLGARLGALARLSHCAARGGTSRRRARRRARRPVRAPSWPWRCRSGT